MHQYLWHAWVGCTTANDCSYNPRLVAECKQEAQGNLTEHCARQRRPVCVETARDAAIQCAWHLSVDVKEAYIWVMSVGTEIEDAELWCVRWRNITMCTAERVSQGGVDGLAHD